MSHVVNMAKPVDLTGKVVRESGFASHGGGYADIFTGTYHRGANAHKVAIKVIRTQIYNNSDQEIMGKVDKISMLYVDRRLIGNSSASGARGKDLGVPQASQRITAIRNCVRLWPGHFNDQPVDGRGRPYSVPQKERRCFAKER